MPAQILESHIVMYLFSTATVASFIKCGVMTFPVSPPSYPGVKFGNMCYILSRFNLFYLFNHSLDRIYLFLYND